MITKLLPLALAQLKNMPLREKRQAALFLEALAHAFSANNPEAFAEILNKLISDKDTKINVMGALWHDPNRSGK